MSALVLENVGKRFGGVTAVDGVSLQIKPGSVTGLIGPNGAGKTTVVNLITGMLKVSSGSISLMGQDVTSESPQRIARRGVARTFQNIRLLKDASVLDNLIVGYHMHEQTNLFANFVGLPSVWRERARFREQAMHMLDRFGMRQFAEHPSGALSYGHQRRVEMMRALAMSPQLLLLDEPVAGMNDVEAYELAEIFGQLAREGLGILLIEHNMRFVMKLCDYVYVLAFGKLIAQGAAADVTSDQRVIDAYLGG
jgi:branched-chain amino acid transport system ATP-binding protein